jgi:hypothetical protein
MAPGSRADDCARFGGPGLNARASFSFYLAIPLAKLVMLRKVAGREAEREEKAPKAKRSWGS